jgi:hypothetical protein
MGAFVKATGCNAFEASAGFVGKTRLRSKPPTKLLGLAGFMCATEKPLYSSKAQSRTTQERVLRPYRHGCTIS